jgi:hypothetical protein
MAIILPVWSPWFQQGLSLVLFFINSFRRTEIRIKFDRFAPVRTNANEPLRFIGKTLRMEMVSPKHCDMYLCMFYNHLNCGFIRPLLVQKYKAKVATYR